jgi:hypothetical protein
MREEISYETFYLVLTAEKNCEHRRLNNGGIV